MLYGNIIFIKKSGGDGSKFPVTEKSIKIGRSEDCLIRIYNPHVASEHCQLIVEDNGQTKLRNLSNQTILNGKPLGQGDVVLCHGDIFKLGERLARWEYLPSSKYYKQVLSPTGCLVAVVMPQQRLMGEHTTLRKSASHTSVFSNTPLGKRKYSSIQDPSEGSSVAKLRKSSGAALPHQMKGDLPKMLTGRHSLKAMKLLLHGTKVKERKSMLNIAGSSTPVAKSRKSSLPSWKVKIVSPKSRKSTSSRKSLTKSSEKPATSPKSELKMPLKNAVTLKSSVKPLFMDSESELETPRRKSIAEFKASETLVYSSTKNATKTPLKSIPESHVEISKGSVRSSRNFSKAPSPKKSLKKSSPTLPCKVILTSLTPKSPQCGRLVHSEKKIKPLPEKQHAVKRNRRMSLMLEKVKFTDAQNLMRKSSKSPAQEQVKLKVSEEFLPSSVIINSGKSVVLDEAFPVEGKKNSRKSVNNTPEKSKNNLRKSVLKKSVKSPTEIKTPRKSVLAKTPRSLGKRSKTLKTARVVTTDLIDFNCSPSPKKNESTPQKSFKSTPIKKSHGKVKSVGKNKSPSLSSGKKYFSQNEAISLSSTGDLALNSIQTSSSSKKLSIKRTPSRKSVRPSKDGVSSSRGIRRKLSPSSSAERAAKMLKTSSPKKPDKNKKAALLVLGKANRKQLLSQNLKVLLKQKIVKKAIKQTTVAASQKSDFKKKVAAEVNRKKVQNSKLVAQEKNKSSKKEKSTEKSSSPKTIKTSSVSVKSPVKTEEKTSKSVTETIQLQTPKVAAPPRLSSKSKVLGKSPSDHGKKSESLLNTSKKENSSLMSSYNKLAENYLFNSNRRSKRLSSKNDTGRPDFIELSPTALGLMPKNVDVFKNPKETKRRSLSLSTPKNTRTTGIIKSASTSKITNRKSVRFLSKDVSFNTEIYTPSTADKIELEFSSINTPDVTLDMFVSPLTDKSGAKKKDLNDLKVLAEENYTMKSCINSLEPKTCVRKLLQSPQSNNLDQVSPGQKSLSRKRKSPASKSASPTTAKPKETKSPKNDFTDIRGVKKMLKTPKVQKSPKNDLTNVEGVKKLFHTPRVQKSPRNDLTDFRGVKKLLQTPKVQKSPKNDLSDVRGVKKLLKTPKVQNSPKNDLSDVRGVKKLLQTPKVQKSPKNDLTNLEGVKQLLGSPRVQKSPKNDLSDLKGVKTLFASPKVQKSPKNDLTNLEGVKQLLGSPRVQKSPKNDLSDLKGVKTLFASPKVQKSPKNDLSNVTGVKKLLATPRVRKSPKNNLLDVSGVGNLFESPKVVKVAKHSDVNVSQLEENSSGTGVKQLVSKSSEIVLKSSKVVSPKPRVKDYKAIRGRRTIYSTPQGPKNDLSDLTGVRELFSRHKPTSDYNISFTGVAELFDFPEVITKQKRGRAAKKSIAKPGNEPVAKKITRAKKESESEIELIATPRGRSRKVKFEVQEEEPRKKQTRGRKKEDAEESESKKPRKQKVATKKTAESPEKSQKGEETAETSGKKSRGKAKTESLEDIKEIKTTRKRKALVEEPETMLPKLRRKLTVAEKSKSGGTPERGASRSRKETVEKKTSEESGQKVASKATTKKNGTKRTQKVQNRSRSSSYAPSKSEVEPSPKITRSVKATRETRSQSRTTNRKTTKSSIQETQSPPTVKRSTRRK